MQKKKNVSNSTLIISVLTVVVISLQLIVLYSQYLVSSKQADIAETQNQIIQKQDIAHQKVEILQLFKWMTELARNSINVSELEYKYCVASAKEYPDSLILPIVCRMLRDAVPYKIDKFRNIYLDVLIPQKIEFTKACCEILSSLKESLKSADLSFSYLTYTDFSEGNLSFANLTGTRASDGLYFLKSNLRGIELPSASLPNANFFKADLRGAVLYDTNIRESNLIMANLDVAFILCSDLRDIEYFWPGKVHFKDAILIGNDYSTSKDSSVFVQFGAITNVDNFRERWKNIDWAQIDKEMRYFYVRNYKLFLRFIYTPGYFNRNYFDNSSLSDLLDIPRDINNWHLYKFENWIKKNCPADSLRSIQRPG